MLRPGFRLAVILRERDSITNVAFYLHHMVNIFANIFHGRF